MSLEAKRDEAHLYLCGAEKSAIRLHAPPRPTALHGSEGDPMDIVSLIIQLVAGAVGGNVAGAAVKQYSLGTVGNSIAGIVGGGIGGQILAAVAPSLAGAAAGGGLDISAIIGQIVGGGVGGGVLMVIVGIIKQMLAGGQKAQ
jgi:hypothetical protein